MNFERNVFLKLFLISKLSEPRALVSNPDELASSEFSYLANGIFKLQMNESDFFKRISNRFIETSKNATNFYKELAARRIAIIEFCSSIEFFRNSFFKGAKDMNELFYVMDTKLNTFYLEFNTPSLNFFLHRLRELSLRVFEAGLRQNWNELASELVKRPIQESYIDFEDVYPVFFSIFLVQVLAIVIFFLELLFQKISSRFEQKLCKKSKIMRTNV